MAAKKEPVITDSRLLAEVLKRLDGQQLAAIFQDFGPGTPLAAALQKRLALYHIGTGDPNRETSLALLAEEVTGALEGMHGRERTFCEELLRFTERAQRSEASIYNAAGLSRNLWYHLRKSPNAKTSKRNVLKLGIVLGLDYLELYYWLALSGHLFTPAANRTDCVIMTCMRMGCYDPEQIDAQLCESGEPALFSEL